MATHRSRWAAGLAVLLTLASPAAFGQWPGTRGGNANVSPFVSREEAIVVSIRTSAASRGLGIGEEEENQPQEDVAWTPAERLQELDQEDAVASGFVIDADGYILTNAHVVAGVDEIVVRLVDKRQFRARVIGIDRRTDVGLIKIDANGLATARIGDPSRVGVGEWVFAIGAPFGLESSVTAGIVSARPRYLPGGGGVALIQTDVAINPGSSGCPLFNLRGEVIGMNSMIMTRSGGYVGVSLALPIDQAMRVADELRAHGRVTRSQLGLQVQEVTPELARAFGRASSSGAIITGVVPRGPAAQAGLRVGDILLGIDSSGELAYPALQQRIADSRPGVPLRLAVWRHGTVIQAMASPNALDPGDAASAPSADDPEIRLGLTLAEVRLPPEAGAAAPGAGVRVERVRGSARRAGIHAGDVVSVVNDIAVASVEAFDAALAAAPAGRPVALLVRRGAALSFVAVDAPR